MKQIKAVVDPSLLHRVMAALHALPHFPGVTVTDCQGQGRGRGEGGKYISTGNALSFERKIKLEIFCADSMCDELVSTIQTAGHVGHAGHGMIMVADLERVVRIHSGQEGDTAV